MKLSMQTGPFLQKERSVTSVMKDMILALLLLSVMPVIRYGGRVLVILVISVLICMLTESAALAIFKKGHSLFDGSAVVTGLIVALMLPVNAPLWLFLLAAFAASAFKAIFGGTGKNPLNPAAFGLSLVTVLFPKTVFSYCVPVQTGMLPLFQNCTVEQAVSPAAVIKSGFMPGWFPSQLMFGEAPGAMGITFAIVIAACAVYLLIRRHASWQTILSFLLACALFAFLFPRFYGSRISSVEYELLSGALLFGAVFMITDPVTSPKTHTGHLIYGFCGGILLMLLRRFGLFEEAMCFTILLMNLLTPLIDFLVIRMKMR